MVRVFIEKVGNIPFLRYSPNGPYKPKNGSTSQLQMMTMYDWLKHSYNYYSQLETVRRSEFRGSSKGFTNLTQTFFCNFNLSLSFTISIKAEAIRTHVVKAKKHSL